MPVAYDNSNAHASVLRSYVCPTTAARLGLAQPLALQQSEQPHLAKHSINLALHIAVPVLLADSGEGRLYSVDDALDRCGTGDPFHWLLLLYCGLSWMCDVSVGHMPGA